MLDDSGAVAAESAEVGRARSSVLGTGSPPIRRNPGSARPDVPRCRLDEFRFRASVGNRRRRDLRSYRELWREGETLLRDLEVPHPFSVAALSDSVRRVRGRPLIILPMPLPSGDDSPYGMWAEYPDADFILHEAGTSPVHRDQIILHEIAHILLGHGAAASLPGRGGTASLGTVSGSGVRPATAMMTRRGYGNGEERDAEIVASLLMAGAPALRASFAASNASDYQALQVLRRLWSRLTAVMPRVVLGPGPSQRDDLHAVGTDLRLRLARRIVEIRDAALLLRGYVSDANAAAARTVLYAAGLVGDDLNAAAEAAWLRAAITARLAGLPPVRPAPTRSLCGGSAMTAEARWLGLVAAAWDRSATVSAATAISSAPD
jgi:hypothetical protein